MSPRRSDLRRRGFEGLPELALAPDEAVRRAVLDAARRRVLHRSVWFILYGGSATITMILAAKYLRWRFGAFVTGLGLPLLTVDVILCLLLIAVMPVGARYLFNPSLRRAVRRELAARGVAVCLRCGYDCRGQREPRCPECGTPFDPKLLSAAGNSP